MRRPTLRAADARLEPRGVWADDYVLFENPHRQTEHTSHVRAR